MRNKIDFKKTISLGLSLGMGLSMVPIKSFASAWYEMDMNDTRTFAYQRPVIQIDTDCTDTEIEENDINDDDEYEDEGMIAASQNELYNELAGDFLDRHGCTQKDITQNLVGVCAWKIAKLVQQRGKRDDLKDISFIDQVYEVISAEDIDQSISESQIQKYMEGYSEEAINAVVEKMLGIEYETYYNIGENTFNAAEYILGTPYAYGTGVNGRLCKMVESLLDRGVDPEDIDIIELSFYSLVLTDDYMVRFGRVRADLLKLNIDVFNGYDEKITNSGIELSDRAKAARQRCIESIKRYQSKIRPKSRRSIVATVGCE